MVSFLRKLSVYFFLAMTLVALPLLYPQPEGEVSSKDLLDKLHFLEEQTKKIEANQKEILARQNKILDKVEEVKVWIVRR